MALIIEDGTIVAGANTYIDVATANIILAYFNMPSLSISNDEASLTAAAQYLESFRDRYKGSKVSSAQSLQFPRINLTIDGFDFPSDEIPEQLKKAQAIAASLVSSGKSLYSNSSGQEILSKSVDVISVTYAKNGLSNSQPIFGLIDAQLQPLLNTTKLSTVRI